MESKRTLRRREIEYNITVKNKVPNENKDIMAQLVNEEALKAVIEHLDLSDGNKQRIKERWLTYVLWWDSRATENKRKHYRLRTIVVIGGVLIPALIGTTVMPNLNELGIEQSNIIKWVAFALSFLVGISAALEEIFRYGEIWREKRAVGEMLKCEGWRYFQLTGKYKGKNHDESFHDFAAAVEDMIEHEIKDYFIIIMPKKDH